MSESTRTLDAKTVVIITRTAKADHSKKTRREAWFLAKLAMKRLEELSSGALTLAADVRLPKDAVISALWKIRKAALDRWSSARAEEGAEAEPALG